MQNREVTKFRLTWYCNQGRVDRGNTIYRPDISEGHFGRGHHYRICLPDQLPSTTFCTSASHHRTTKERNDHTCKTSAHNLPDRPCAVGPSRALPNYNGGTSDLATSCGILHRPAARVVLRLCTEDTTTCFHEFLLTIPVHCQSFKPQHSLED